MSVSVNLFCTFEKYVGSGLFEIIKEIRKKQDWVQTGIEREY